MVASWALLPVPRHSPFLSLHSRLSATHCLSPLSSPLVRAHDTTLWLHLPSAGCVLQLSWPWRLALLHNSAVSPSCRAGRHQLTCTDYPNGKEAPKSEKPCSSGPGSACCPDKWQCLDNGLCYYPGEDLHGRYSCSDKSWKSPGCPSNLCTYSMWCATHS
jgi:hypothetical protein